jgi:acetyl-CoA acetyltransferase
MAYITSAGHTRFGKCPGDTTLTLMAQAATRALERADLKRADIDGLLTAYSSTLPHFMLGTLFAEYFGLQPSYCHALLVGGATGFAMMMLAARLVDAGECDNVLVVAGENRLTGQGRDAAVQTLAQVGHADFELPFGATIPAYYGLVASRYMHKFNVDARELAELAVLMRRHASTHPDAQMREPITVDDVVSSKVIAAPLRLLDCCLISDGGVAFVVSKQPRAAASIRIAGAAQAHTHQHVSQAPSLTQFGAAASAKRALERADVTLRDIDYLAIYDSFTITLAILLEEIGFAARGQSGTLARDGHFNANGKLPLNTHGGLLSFGHSGAGGAMAHLAEAWLQMAGLAGVRQIRQPSLAFVHGDGGVLSSHVSLVLQRE